MASIVYLFLAILGAASAAPESRLVGTSPTSIENFPFAVAFTYFYPRPSITVQRCVGSLISSYHVLTTAYCFTGAVLENMQVRAGSTNSLSGGTLVNIREYVSHPDYDETPRSNDIAVTFLVSPLGISDTINVLYLPPPYSYIPDGQTFEVFSWGFESETGSQLDALHTVSLDKISVTECQTIYADDEEVTISDNVICANAPGKGTCTGDSGAPLVIDNVLVGTSSFFRGCLDDDYPDVFSRVDRHTNWILEVASTSNSDSQVRIAPVTV